jgi:hypothetical protein
MDHPFNPLWLSTLFKNDKAENCGETAQNGKKIFDPKLLYVTL